LRVRIVERHVAGADVEVGVERARVLERRPFVVEALATRTVAAAAVRGVEALALRHVREHSLRRRCGLGGRDEQQHEDQEQALHDWWQGRW
jgi:hypothetical protein